MKNFFKSIKAVAWSFVGLRSGSGFEADKKLTPSQVLIAAVCVLALFLTTLVALVKLALYYYA